MLGNTEPELQPWIRSKHETKRLTAGNTIKSSTIVDSWLLLVKKRQKIYVCRPKCLNSKLFYLPNSDPLISGCFHPQPPLSRWPNCLKAWEEASCTSVPVIKCHNVMVLTAKNVDELDQQWDDLIDLRSTKLLAPAWPFISKHLSTSFISG